MSRNNFYLIILAVFILIIASNSVSAEGNTTIQSLIDNAEEGDTVVVSSGNYSEDVVISKSVNLQTDGEVNLNSNNTAISILSSGNGTSIKGFNIFVSNDEGKGISINASNCLIDSNKISGGSFGIFSNLSISDNISFSILNNITIVNNEISNVAGTGIYAFAQNVVIANNSLTDIYNDKVNGTSAAINVNTASMSDSPLNVTVAENIISNVKSVNASAYGINAGANSVIGPVGNINFSKNRIKNVEAPIESYGMSIAIFSLSELLPNIMEISDLDISNITSNTENGTVTALSLSLTTLNENDTAKLYLKNNNIYNLKALSLNSKVTGVSAISTGSVNLHIENNNVNNVQATSSATAFSVNGINYNDFNQTVYIWNNTVLNFDSLNSQGILAVALGNISIKQNIIQNLSGDNSSYITVFALTLNGTNVSIPENITIEDLLNMSGQFLPGNISIIGNNLEGISKGTGIVTITNPVVIYNRIVNFDINIAKQYSREYILNYLGYDSNMTSEELVYLYLKSQKEFENYTEEELRNLSKTLGEEMDQLFDNLNNMTQGNIDARYNWWGTNDKLDDSKFINHNGNISYTPWLVMSISANPTHINVGENSTIDVNVYTDSLGINHSVNASGFFSGPKLTLKTSIGTFDGKSSITLNWTLGRASAQLYGSSEGIAFVMASDYDDVSATVIIGNLNPDEYISNIDSNGKISNSSSKISANESEDYQYVVEGGNTVSMIPAANPVLLILCIILAIPLIYKRR